MMPYSSKSLFLHNHMSNESSPFGGIFSKLSKLVFVDEVQPSSNTNKNVINENPKGEVPKQEAIVNSSMQVKPSDDMLAKVHGLVASINKPGIDFFELWNAAEAMGGINSSSVANAFVALKVASGDTLTKSTIISTGEYYCQALKDALASDVAQKATTKQELLATKSSNNKNLTQEISDLNQQISALQHTLQIKTKELHNLDANFEPKIKAIDDKINAGNTAVEKVINEMRNVISMAQQSINE
jgi:hypothetical protein